MADPLIKPGGAIPELLRELLAKRGLTDEVAIQRYLFPDYKRDMHDPWLLADMELAVERVMQAIAARERVAVYGDYDIDGLTATTILSEVLRAQGLDVLSYIPDRFEEGYGLNQPALEHLLSQGIGLEIGRAHV